VPTFATPEPIFATIDIAAGSVRINVSDRPDTAVEVRPSDESDDADIEAAEQTQVAYSEGKLFVKAPKRKARWWFFRWDASIDVTVDLPAGSRVHVQAASADVHCEGRLGESKVNTASGDITVARSSGHTDVTTVHGEIWIREIDGSAVVKNTHGSVTLGEVTGNLRLNTAHGDISVGRALAGVAAKTAYGSVRIGEVVRGSVVLETAGGDLEVGVREGTAAWLDVTTQYGSVRNSLGASDGPEPSDEIVKVRAHTSYGDIVIRRS
jgi:DUF4097 and DUF4098 domain-containing protein YvlB